jgi:hypothetical protein
MADEHLIDEPIDSRMAEAVELTHRITCSPVFNRSSAIAMLILTRSHSTKQVRASDQGKPHSDALV